MANNADVIDLMNEVERLRGGVETLHNTVAVQKRELDGLEAKNERLRAAANEWAYLHGQRGARIDAALAYLGDVCACDTGPCDFCVIRKALKGEA